jgi:hypothetical protein
LCFVNFLKHAAGCIGDMVIRIERAVKKFGVVRTATETSVLHPHLFQRRPELGHGVRGAQRP